MATAVEPGSEPRTPTPPLGLPLASILGAVYVVAAIAVVFYAVPAVWKDFVAPSLASLSFVEAAGRWTLQIVALVLLVWFGRQLTATAPRGVHGGIFLVISWAIAIFFLWRAVALNFDGQAGLIVSLVFAGLLIFIALRFLNGRTGERWMLALEEQGWFSTAYYKPSLGVRVRRLTTLGILLVGGTGVYSLNAAGTLPANWTLAMPFESLRSVVVMPDAQWTIPIIIALVVGWFAWRAVNVPTFAEFLIATEAEMNKVSWTPKKRLAQDTVVVLTTTLLMALFLLVVDLFWGWLLSRETVGVLPGKPTNQDKGANAAQQAKW